MNSVIIILICKQLRQSSLKYKFIKSQRNINQNIIIHKQITTLSLLKNKNRPFDTLGITHSKLNTLKGILKMSNNQNSPNHSLSNLLRYKKIKVKTKALGTSGTKLWQSSILTKISKIVLNKSALNPRHACRPLSTSHPSSLFWIFLSKAVLERLINASKIIQKISFRNLNLESTLSGNFAGIKIYLKNVLINWKTRRAKSIICWSNSSSSISKNSPKETYSTSMARSRQAKRHCFTRFWIASCLDVELST